MQLDTTEKAEVLADAIKIYRATNRGPFARVVFTNRLHHAGFNRYFIEDTLCEIDQCPPNCCEDYWIKKT